MSGHAMFRCGLVFAGFLLGACSVAEAKIPLARQTLLPPANPYSTLLSQNPGPPLAGLCQGSPAVTKTVTLDFGPLHYREILTNAPITCRS